ncbi:twin-arginine translocase TatA/TatE family subunit [Sphingomicrobium lutaoense]|uniref:Sec-independent protein translocase protein TatA n=1 Tax=Sphingomicrobium lutaoense TaxID=515949 RepID=A0A839YYX3_9SPHN|nr:twin-arginine translocase TatA/TatE family subunit [Sphingomicrobium lutaoense]MBB3764339.1 sec-independent protein translocase protein TatA [Sphingomicrobium lutaoense]
MSQIGLPGILILALLLLLLFGRNRFSNMMGDVAKGLKNFKKGLSDEDEAANHQAPPRQLPREDKAIDAQVTGEREREQR